MNVRKRPSDMGTPAGPPPRNAVTKAKPGVAQAAGIRNTHNQPKSKGYGRVRNAVSG
jgi:hypothetical protein